jgi:hypothetical protein
MGKGEKVRKREGEKGRERKGEEKRGKKEREGGWDSYRREENGMKVVVTSRKRATKLCGWVRRAICRLSSLLTLAESSSRLPGYCTIASSRNLRPGHVKTVNLGSRVIFIFEFVVLNERRRIARMIGQRERSESCTDKKEKKIFLLYKEIQMGSGAKSYMRQGFLIYEEMPKYLVMYEEAVSHI